MKYVSWREEDGVIHCTTDLGADIVMVAQGAEAQNVERILSRWGDLIRVVAGRYNVPWEWVVAMIAREDPTGDPNVVSFDRGVGLMQVTDPGLKGNHSDEQLKDPQLNLDIGVRYLASKRKMYGDDFPRCSASYNAGGVYPGADPWGMKATGDHISVEVRALNYLRLRALPAAIRAQVLAAVDQAATAEVSDVIDPMGATTPEES